jgi:hypothetical protein
MAHQADGISRRGVAIATARDLEQRQHPDGSFGTQRSPGSRIASSISSNSSNSPNDSTFQLKR